MLSTITLAALLSWGIPKNSMFGVHLSNLTYVPLFFKLLKVDGTTYRSCFINISARYERPVQTWEHWDTTDTNTITQETNLRSSVLGLRAGIERLHVRPLKDFSSGVKLNFLSGYTPFVELSDRRTKSSRVEDSVSITDERSLTDGGVGLTGVWGVEAKFQLFGKDMAIQILNGVFTVKAGYKIRRSNWSNGMRKENFTEKGPYIEFSGLNLSSGRLSVWLLVKI